MGPGPNSEQAVRDPRGRPPLGTGRTRCLRHPIRFGKANTVSRDSLILLPHVLPIPHNRTVGQRFLELTDPLARNACILKIQ